MTYIKIYKNGVKTKKAVLMPSYKNLTNLDMWKLIREGDINIIGENEHSRMIKILKSVENKSDIDLNKVIRSGGFVSYIKKLERKEIGCP